MAKTDDESLKPFSLLREEDVKIQRRTGLLIKVAIARYAERKASLEICRAVPLFYLTEEHKDIIMPRNRLKWYR